MAPPAKPPRGARRLVVSDPLDLDHLVRLEQERPIVPSSPYPERVPQRVVLSMLEATRKAPALRPVRGIPGSYSIDGKMAIGVLGRSSGLLKPRDMPRSAEAATAPKRPRSIEFNYLPRIVPRPAKPLLRTIGGKLIRPENVYGDEERTTFWPSGYPWHCTGRLFMWTDPSNPWGVQSGTGVLIGPRHVLTCGHLCPWGSKPWMMLFVPGYYDGVSVPNVSSYVSDYRGYYTGNTSGRDMAVLRLYDPLGDQLGWFGSKRWEPRWLDKAYWSQIGWAGAIADAQRPSFQTNISVIRVDAEKNALELLHRGDTSEGTSGGPLYGWWPDGCPYAVGTHSGTDLTVNKDHNAAAGGQALVDLILWAHANWQ